MKPHQERTVMIRKTQSRMAYLDREQVPYRVDENVIFFECTDEELFTMGVEYQKLFLPYYNPDKPND